jgi:hypothetical protein
MVIILLIELTYLTISMLIKCVQFYEPQ